MKIEHDKEIKLIINRLENDKEVKYECSYIVMSYHRNNSLPKKSNWIINEEEELNCFKKSQKELWVQKNISWGLKYEFVQEKKEKKVIIDVLGINEQKEELKIGRFIDSNENDIWHGYAGDYRRKKQDIPPTSILLEWESLDILKKHQVLKIKKGKKCNL